MPLLSRIISLLVASVVLAGALGLAGEPSPQTAAAEVVLERFRIATDGGPLLVPVAIHGQCYHFMLDTGASDIFYDISLQNLLGEQLGTAPIHTADQDIKVQLFRPSAARLGKLALPMDSHVLCMDMARFRAATGQEIRGVIGREYLASHIFRINFDRGEVTFLRSVGPDPGQKLVVESRESYPQVAMEIPGLDSPEYFLVDTGCCGGFSSGSLRGEVFAALAKRRSLTLAGEMEVLTASGTKVERQGRVGEVCLAGFRHEKLVFNQSKASILGLDYWSRYLVTFDLPHDAIYVKKGRQFNRRDVFDTSGLNILRVKGRTLIDSVVEDSPAARAGVKRQDVLLKIDDAKASESSLFALRRLLCAEGKKCRLLIRRGEKERKMTIHLQNRKP